MTEQPTEPAACDSRVSRRRFLGWASVLPVGVAAVADLVAGAAAEAGAPARPISAGPAQSQQKRYPIPAGDGVSFDQAGQVILARRDGRLTAFSLACPHQRAALTWRQQDDRFQCPRHGSKFRPDGSLIDGRAKRHMDRLPIRREGSEVVVDLQQVIRSDQQPANWAAASVAVS